MEDHTDEPRGLGHYASEELKAVFGEPSPPSGVIGPRPLSGLKDVIRAPAPPSGGIGPMAPTPPTAGIGPMVWFDRSKDF